MRVEAESLRVSQIQNERSELEKQKDDMLEEMALHPRSESMDVELKDLEKKIDALSRQCFNIKSCPDSEIFDVEAEVFDWKQISAVKVTYLLVYQTRCQCFKSLSVSSIAHVRLNNFGYTGVTT